MPEGRTRRRPEIDLTFSSKCASISLTAFSVVSLDFCSALASRLTVAWGSFSNILERSLRDFFVSEMVFTTMRAVSIPSPVDSFGRMVWPDCSPPISRFFSRMAAATFESPTSVISSWRFFPVAQFRRP